MWYDKVCGGRKAYQSLVAGGLITLAYLTLPLISRPGLFLQYCGAILLCFGFYVYGNIREHQANGKGKNANGT